MEDERGEEDDGGTELNPEETVTSTGGETTGVSCSLMGGGEDRGDCEGIGESVSSFVSSTSRERQRGHVD